MIVDAKTQDDVECIAQYIQIINGPLQIGLDGRLQQFVGEPKSRLAGPVLARVVGRQDPMRFPALRVKRPVAIPAADVENGLSSKIEPIELVLDEAPQSSMRLGIGRLGLGAQAAPEVKFVIPMYGVD